MKIVDRIVLVVYILALVVLCFFRSCTLDTYFLVLGFAVAIAAGIYMFLNRRKEA